MLILYQNICVNVHLKRIVQNAIVIHLKKKKHKNPKRAYRYTFNNKKKTYSLIVFYCEITEYNALARIARAEPHRKKNY